MRRLRYRLGHRHDNPFATQFPTASDTDEGDFSEIIRCLLQWADHPLFASCDRQRQYFLQRRVWRATAAAAHARRTANKRKIYAFITTRACELDWRPRLPSRLPLPRGGWPPNWHHGAVSALPSELIRTCSALAPHLLLTCADFFSYLFRTCSELVPHLCRTCAALVPGLFRDVGGSAARRPQMRKRGCEGTAGYSPLAISFRTAVGTDTSINKKF